MNSFPWSQRKNNNQPLVTNQFDTLLVMWLNNVIKHPPVITIFIGGMFTIPKWVVYDIVYPTLLVFPLLHVF